MSRTLVWTRNGTTYSAPFKPAFIPAGEAGDLGLKQDRYDSGFKVISGDLISPNPVSNQALVSSAIRYAIDETWSGIRIIGIGFKLLFQGDVSMRSLGGPLMIGQLAGQAGQAGASTFIWIMALISLNLGLLNLLPIPVLDGGQIVFIAVEAVTRQPIGHIIKERVMLVGVVMLLVLMLFATWNDIARILVG
jgi:regulator of sigma E protease